MQGFILRGCFMGDEEMYIMEIRVSADVRAALLGTVNPTTIQIKNFTQFLNLWQHRRNVVLQYFDMHDSPAILKISISESVFSSLSIVLVELLFSQCLVILFEPKHDQQHS
eukprot:2258675-Amphidinium_carterae.1